MESGSDGRIFKGRGAGLHPRGGWESVDGGLTREDALEGWCMKKRPSKRSVGRNAHYPALNGNGKGRTTPWVRGRADDLRVGGVVSPRDSRVPDRVRPMTPTDTPTADRLTNVPLHPSVPTTYPGQQAHRAWQGPLPPQIFVSGPRRAPHIALQSGLVEQCNSPTPQNLEQQAVMAADAPSREQRTITVTGVDCGDLGATGCTDADAKLTTRGRCGTRISLADLMASVSQVPARRHGLQGGADQNDGADGGDDPVWLFDSRGHLPCRQSRALKNDSGTFCFGISALQLMGACVPLLTGFLGPKPDKYITEENIHVRRILANMLLPHSQEEVHTRVFRAGMSRFSDRQQHCINEFMDFLLQEVTMDQPGPQGGALPSIVAALSTTKVVWGTCAKPECCISQPVVPGSEVRISIQRSPGLRLRVPAGPTPLPLATALQGPASCHGVVAVCQSCGFHLEAGTMQIRLCGEPPLVLPCYLDRMESVGGQEHHRVDRRVEVQETMLIECMTADFREGQRVSYTVVGVALHTGTSKKGHYRAIIRRPTTSVESPEFLLYDDNSPVQSFPNLQTALEATYKYAGHPVITTVMLVRTDMAFLPVGAPMPVAVDLLRQARGATSVAGTDVKGTKAFRQAMGLGPRMGPAMIISTTHAKAATVQAMTAMSYHTGKEPEGVGESPEVMVGSGTGSRRGGRGTSGGGGGGQQRVGADAAIVVMNVLSTTDGPAFVESLLSGLEVNGEPVVTTSIRWMSVPSLWTSPGMLYLEFCSDAARDDVLQSASSGIVQRNCMDMGFNHLNIRKHRKRRTRRREEESVEQKWNELLSRCEVLRRMATFVVAATPVGSVPSTMREQATEYLSEGRREQELRRAMLIYQLAAEYAHNQGDAHKYMDLNGRSSGFVIPAQDIDASYGRPSGGGITNTAKWQAMVTAHLHSLVLHEHEVNTVPVSSDAAKALVTSSDDSIASPFLETKMTGAGGVDMISDEVAGRSIQVMGIHRTANVHKFLSPLLGEIAGALTDDPLASQNPSAMSTDSGHVDSVGVPAAERGGEVGEVSATHDLLKRVSLVTDEVDTRGVIDALYLRLEFPTAELCHQVLRRLHKSSMARDYLRTVNSHISNIRLVSKVQNRQINKSAQISTAAQSLLDDPIIGSMGVIAASEPLLTEGDLHRAANRRGVDKFPSFGCNEKRGSMLVLMESYLDSRGRSVLSDGEHPTDGGSEDSSSDTDGNLSDMSTDTHGVEGSASSERVRTQGTGGGGRSGDDGGGMNVRRGDEGKRRREHGKRDGYAGGGDARRAVATHAAREGAAAPGATVSASSIPSARSQRYPTPRVPRFRTSTRPPDPAPPPTRQTPPVSRGVTFNTAPPAQSGLTTGHVAPINGRSDESTTQSASRAPKVRKVTSQGWVNCLTPVAEDAADPSDGVDADEPLLVGGQSDGSAGTVDLSDGVDADEADSSNGVAEDEHLRVGGKIDGPEDAAELSAGVVADEHLPVGGQLDGSEAVADLSVGVDADDHLRVEPLDGFDL